MTTRKGLFRLAITCPHSRWLKVHLTSLQTFIEFCEHLLLSPLILLENESQEDSNDMTALKYQITWVSQSTIHCCLIIIIIMLKHRLASWSNDFSDAKSRRYFLRACLLW